MTWTDLQIAYALALLWVENNSGKSVIRHNFGNLASGGYSNGVDSAWWTGLYWRPPWYERPPLPQYAELNERMLAGQVPSAFRAYATLDDGIRAFVGLLNSSKYAPLLAAAESNNTEAYVSALNATGYSKDYNAKHVPRFRALVDSFGYPLTAQGELVASRGSSILPIVLGVLTLGGIGAMVWRGYLSRKPRRTR
jgi:hypothetical protein